MLAGPRSAYRRRTLQKLFESGIEAIGIILGLSHCICYGLTFRLAL
jgi:hypothetical protein